MLTCLDILGGIPVTLRPGIEAIIKTEGQRGSQKGVQLIMTKHMFRDDPNTWP